MITCLAKMTRPARCSTSRVSFGYIAKETELTARQPLISRGRSSCCGCGWHLQGCYADLDGLLSTLAVLRRP